MSQNHIQFQRGMSLAEFQDRFGTEEQCEAALEDMRWPNGFVCPICANHSHSLFVVEGRRVWQCASCRHQTTVRSGTLLHASKVPLVKWFLAIYLISQDKNNHSTLSLKRYLGVSYRTAWRLKHKLLEAMLESESKRKLSGNVVADDAYLGGAHHGKRGRGSENKVPFMAAVQCNDDGYPLYVRFDQLPDLKSISIKEWASKALHTTASLVTDGLTSLAAATGTVANHTPVVVTPKKSSDFSVFMWINVVISNLKTSISGTYHHVKFKKYAARYLAEAQYRLNHRFNLYTIAEQLVEICVTTPPCTEKWLRLGVVRNL